VEATDSVHPSVFARTGADLLLLFRDILSSLYRYV